ncbi:MAG: hypothetical protein AAB372_02485 [Patescibacteria group bacterium]
MIAGYADNGFVFGTAVGSGGDPSDVAMVVVRKHADILHGVDPHFRADVIAVVWPFLNVPYVDVHFLFDRFYPTDEICPYRFALPVDDALARPVVAH